MRKIIYSFAALMAAVALTSARPEGKETNEKRTIYAGVAFYNQGIAIAKVQCVSVICKSVFVFSVALRSLSRGYSY